MWPAPCNTFMPSVFFNDSGDFSRGKDVLVQKADEVCLGLSWCSPKKVVNQYGISNTHILEYDIYIYIYISTRLAGGYE